MDFDCLRLRVFCLFSRGFSIDTFAGTAASRSAITFAALRVFLALTITGLDLVLVGIRDRDFDCTVS
jgi:hypothetical protein